MKNLNEQEWRDQISNDPNAVIIDVRTPEEVEEGYIPNADFMNIQQTAEFYERVKQLDPEKNYYIYCKSGGRSGQACALFDALGIKNTYNLLDGITSYNGEINH